MCHVVLSLYSDTAFEPVAASACFSQGHQMDGSSFACTSILGTISVVSIFIILLGITLISKITLFKAHLPEAKNSQSPRRGAGESRRYFDISSGLGSGYIFRGLNFTPDIFRKATLCVHKKIFRARIWLPVPARDIHICIPILRVGLGLRYPPLKKPFALLLIVEKQIPLYAANGDSACGHSFACACNPVILLRYFLSKKKRLKIGRTIFKGVLLLFYT